MTNDKVFERESKGYEQNELGLLMEIDQHIEDSSFRDDLKQSLKEMTDIRFALDESTIVAITNHKGQIKYVNDKFCEISKFNRDELIGQDHRIINSGYHDKAFMTNLWETISSGKVWKGEIKNRAKDGSYYWVNTTIVPFLSSEGAPYQYLAIRNEVTQLKKAEEELKFMMNRVLEIQEEERKRFSRELHDGIGQSLFSLIIHMDRMMSEDNYSSMQTLRNEVSGIMEEIRSLAWDLRPSLLDDLGVVPAINRHIDKFSQYYGIDVEFTCDLRHRLDMQKETTIYRIIQESLTNIAKYANVSEAYVTLTETDDYVQAIIKDEGKGFVRNNGKGVGLFSMEERARSVNGTFDILSEPGKGTTVTLVVPKA